VLAKLAGLISAATSMVTAHQASADELVSRARAVIDRADEQLASSAAITESVEQVTASMSDLSDQVTAVAGTARLIAAGLGAPVLRLAAAAYGIRRAIASLSTASGRPRGGKPMSHGQPATRPAATAPGHVAGPVPARALPGGQVPRRAAAPLGRAARRAAVPDQVQR